VVVCKTHRVQVCTGIPVIKKLQWLKGLFIRKAFFIKFKLVCPIADAPCWKILQHFYAPNGLFPNLKKLGKMAQESKLRGFCNAIQKKAVFLARKESITYYEMKGNKFKTISC
jgi:hypothetical protein